MHERADTYMAMLRTGRFGIATALVLMFIVLASCDEGKRHRALTFFFDGVPPLPGDMSKYDPLDPNDPNATGGLTTGGWYVHEPLQDCTQCHASRRRARFSREVQLVAEVPQLCYQCHAEYATLPGWVHGPVAAGDCLFCHEPHKTKTAFLLTNAVPDLCYRCHEPEAVNLVAHHDEPAYARCIECHAGHAGATRYLLRPAFLETEAGKSYRSVVHRQQYEQALAQARDALAQGRDVSAMLRMATDHVAGGRWWDARATLEVIAGSQTISVDERQRVGGILEQVVALSEAEAPPETARTEISAALDAIREQRDARQRALADLYYQSIQAYRAGRLAEARTGFVELLDSDDLLEPVRETAQRYLAEIDQTLSQTQDAEPSHPEP